MLTARRDPASRPGARGSASGACPISARRRWRARLACRHVRPRVDQPAGLGPARRLVRRPRPGLLGGDRAQLGHLADPTVTAAGAARRRRRVGGGRAGLWHRLRLRLAGPPGARPVGLDNSTRQLATARAMQVEFDLACPLLHADAERVPLADDTADLVISEYGAALWCDPYRWIPEAARLLRPGGRLVFMTNAVQVVLCAPDVGTAGRDLLRPLFGLHRVEYTDDDGVEFHLPHGDLIRLLRQTGFEVEDLIEVRAPEDAASDYDFVTGEWARDWPSEEVWFARRR
ncbi:MAG TPA: class I SAM-dependent methyltransferase [Micromonospora sp.]